MGNASGSPTVEECKHFAAIPQVVHANGSPVAIAQDAGHRQKPIVRRQDQRVNFAFLARFDFSAYGLGCSSACNIPNADYFVLACRVKMLSVGAEHNRADGIFMSSGVDDQDRRLRTQRLGANQGANHE
jgi:hypothetical protein